MSKLGNILLVGELGAGKDSVAEMLPGYYRVAFADTLKMVARMLRTGQIIQAYDLMHELFDKKPPYGMYKQLQSFADFPRTEEKDRRLLQELGTNWARAHDPDVWVRGLKMRLLPDNLYVVTDTRFPNEFDAFPDWTSIYVTAPLEVRKERIIKRDGRWDDAWTNHPSELHAKEIGERCTIQISNDGTIDDLVAKLGGYLV